MKTIIIEKLQRILKNKVRLEKILNIKISNRGKEVTIEGKAEDEYIAEQVIDALEFGFPFSIAIKIKDEDFMFEVINIKDHTKRKDLERIRARIIGTKGKTLQALNKISECHFELKDNEVAVIGSHENIRISNNAIISLIKGTKTSNVYAYLEKHQPQPIDDLDLKK